MRSTVELLDIPYTFTQLKPLDTRAFGRAAQKRGLWLSDQELEALHRTNLLVPFFRVRRPRRWIVAAHRAGDDHRVTTLSQWTPSSRDDLLEARELGVLTDPARETFVGRDRLRRELGERRYEASTFLYSQHQLAAVSFVRGVKRWLRLRRRGQSHVGHLDLDGANRDQVVSQARRLRESALLASGFEPAYYPRIVHRFTLSISDDTEAYLEWRRTLPPQWFLTWFEITADELRMRARDLLQTAGLIDPLGSWGELVAAGEPAEWDRLEGPARNAFDLRVAGEILLRYHDGLVEEGLAEPLPALPPRTASPYEERLQRRRPLDALLTKFGLSPHPDLVLVVEGLTELILVPRVMQKLGYQVDEDFISIQDAGGVATRLDSLVAYLAPRLGGGDEHTYVHLLRPLTRFLIVFDPERPVATPEARERRRQLWIDRIMCALPRERQSNDVVREQVEKCVEIVTWNDLGESFEFAHFTDREIARAADRLDRRPKKPTFEDRVAIVAKLRTQRANLEKRLLQPFASKVDLADKLWPVLERKIERAMRRQTERRIPVVQVADRAVELAQEFPRRGLVIALEELKREQTTAPTT